MNAVVFNDDFGMIYEYNIPSKRLTTKIYDLN
jgi:hypothetical protein